MNNKIKGTQFEKKMCEMLAEQGWWVHFIQPKQNGAQPFDIIAVKSGTAVAIDCKTSVNDWFSLLRLEDNQRFAFDKWLSCENSEPIIAVEHDGEVFFVWYSILKKQGKVRLKEGENGIYRFRQNHSNRADC